MVSTPPANGRPNATWTNPATPPAEECRAPLQSDSLASLADAEVKQIRYWKPRTIGEVLLGLSQQGGAGADNLAYQLAFKRMGAPEAAWKDRAGKRLDKFYPAKTREVNVELCKLICFLQPSDGVTKSMALLAKAPTQEEQIEYARALRVLRAGWTPALRAEYFSWFLKAETYKGGMSFALFVKKLPQDGFAVDPDEFLPKSTIDLASLLSVAAVYDRRQFQVATLPAVIDRRYSKCFI